MKSQLKTSTKASLTKVRVGILLPERCWAGSVYLVRELLIAAGALYSRELDVQANALYHIDLLGIAGEIATSFDGTLIESDLSIELATQYAVLIIPAQFAPASETSHQEQLYCDFINKQFKGGATLLSLGGTVLLAKSGILDGREATGLTAEKTLIQQAFPNIRYTPNKRIVASDNVITVCGISPVTDACAYLIERQFGQTLARRFLYFTSAEILPAQEQLALWSARYKRHGDASILKVQDIIERSLDAMPTLAQMAKQVGLSERSLSRRFLKATDMNLRQYQAKLRLELAEFLIRTTRNPLVRIAAECGFASASALSHAFSTQYGKAPQSYRQVLCHQQASSNALS